MTYVIDYDQVVPAWTLPARFEAAFGARWYTDLTDPALAWTDLRGRFIAAGDPTQVSWSRGRTLSSGDMARTPQPGSLTVRLDSADGALTPENPASPYYPNVAPGLPLRWSVFDGTTWQVEFTGFVTDIDPAAVVDGVPDWTQVDLTVTDGWSRIAQAGPRLAFRDRVLTDLASPRDVALLVPDQSETVDATGIHVMSVPTTAKDAWGVGVWRLDAGGTLDWSKPGAAGVLVEVGSGYASGSTGATTTDLTSDRYGGKVVANTVASTLSTTAAAGNNAFQQVSVARGPVQLLPSSTFDPTTVTQWGAPNATLSLAGAPSWVSPRYSYDPVTGARTAIPDGPAHSVVATKSVSTSTTVGLPGVSGIVAGRSYGAHVRLSKSATSMTLLFLDSSGATVGSAFVADGSGGGANLLSTPLTVAPAGAVSARLQIQLDGTGTWGIYAPGIYEGAAPSRWWRGDVTGLQLFAQWPFAILPDGTINEWLHFRCPADVFADGQPHLVAWNRDPGVNGVPTVWVDDAVVSGTWEVSEKVATPQPAARTQIAAGTGSSAAVTGAGDHAPVTTDVAKVTTFMAVTGVVPTYQGQWPSQALATRWATQYGNPAVWPQPATLSGTTDVLMGSLLDSLGWPRSMRALQTGKASSSLSWARLAFDTDGTLTAAPGDYSSDITNLAEAEFGWADVDGRGFLRWLPRRWYDPTYSGAAAAAMHLTYETGLDGAVTYTTALTQQMGEGDVINQVWVNDADAGAVSLSSPAALMEDYDSQARIGIRRGEFVNPAWSTAGATQSVAAEILALYGSARLVASSVTVRCYGADDPYLAAMLALDPADAVVVTVPRAPAADLNLPCLVTQVAATTDGLVTEFVLTLSPCPVPVLTPIPQRIPFVIGA